MQADLEHIWPVLTILKLTWPTFVALHCWKDKQEKPSIKT